jgi:hypothetical protein
MAREIVEKEILGFDYKIEKLGALVGKRVLTRIVRAVGPAFEATNTVEALAAQLSDETVDFLCDTFAAKTRFSAANRPEAEWSLKDKFDDHFSGRYGAMTLWLKECLLANYESFFLELGLSPDGLRSLLATANQPTAPAPTPTGPTTPSGASSPKAGGA